MNAINQSGWRPSMPVGGGDAAPTHTGNKALMLEEALIFEIGDTETTGVDFAQVGADAGSPAQAGARVSADGARNSGFLPLQE